MLAVFAEAEGEPLERRVLGGPLGLTVDADGGEDPAPRSLRGLLADPGRLLGLTEGQYHGTKQGDEAGTHTPEQSTLPSRGKPRVGYFFSRSADGNR